MFGLFPLFGYYKQCCYEYFCTIFLWTNLFISHGCITGTGIAQLYGNSSLKNCQTVFHSGYTILNSYQRCMKSKSHFDSYILFSHVVCVSMLCVYVVWYVQIYMYVVYVVCVVLQRRGVWMNNVYVVCVSEHICLFCIRIRAGDIIQVLRMPPRPRERFFWSYLGQILLSSSLIQLDSMAASNQADLLVGARVSKIWKEQKLLFFLVTTSHIGLE